MEGQRSGKSKNYQKKRPRYTNSHPRAESQGGHDHTGSKQKKDRSDGSGDDTVDVPPTQKQKKVLWWDSPVNHVPLASEESMIEVLVKWQHTERGMVKDQPPFRLARIRKQLKTVDGITLSQALSLRRHHMKLLNPRMSMTQLRLGDESDIRESAHIFEESAAEFLNKCRVNFWTEAEQKQRFFESKKEEGAVLKATPDFLLCNSVILRRVRGRGKSSTILEEREIFWIEAKMFYGASTVPHGSPSAVGSIMAKMRTYVEEFGEGAILFMHGCGDRLASELAEVGVTALDCSGNNISLQKVHEHQRTWCADKNGTILP